MALSLQQQTQLPGGSQVHGAEIKLVDMYQGQDFLKYVLFSLAWIMWLTSYRFSEWNFFTAPDPTHGSVQFQSREDAVAKKLALERKIKI